MLRESRELVFVYGTLRRNASNAFRLKGASWEGMRVVRGTLYQIDWYPGVIVDPDAGLVIGELWAVTPEQLRELDEFEGVPEGQTEGEEYRRVRAPVDGLPDLENLSEWEGAQDPCAPSEAWIWEWKGSPLTAQVIPTGDWLDLETPRQKPLFTSIGCMGVLAFTIGTQSLLGALASQVSFLHLSPTWNSWVSLVSMTLAAALGGYCLYMATRRREPGYPFQLLTGLAVLFFLILVVVSSVLALVTFVLG